MELQWNHRVCDYLQRSIREVQNQEQTQEARLPEGMPDIGRVLCAWGQPVLRSKEWRNDSITVSGGVTAWVLYVPEDGSEPRNMEVWLPFQGKWNLPENRREGMIRVNCLLRGIDARTLSARKLMVRASVGILAEVLENAQAPVYSPDQLPDGVQVLRKTYPAQIPVEAGEKLFTLDETVQIPGEPVRKLLACDLQPVVTEQSALGGKAVFRGYGRLHLVYMGEDDRIHSHYCEIPFAQYADLDRDYDKEATAAVMMAVSSLEPEQAEGQLRIKCGLIAQYMIYERRLLEMVEDAYSPNREVSPIIQMLEMPMLLDRRTETVEAALDLENQDQQIVDLIFLPDHPTQYREDDKMILELPGVFQSLYYDSEGNLQSSNENWFGRWDLPVGEGCMVGADLSASRQPGQIMMADQLQLNGELKLDVRTMVLQHIPMVTGLEVGEPIQPDPERPSLILRRMGDMGLWELAKGCGSTVEAIRNANRLTEEPVPGQMLLIPVY